MFRKLIAALHRTRNKLPGRLSIDGSNCVAIKIRPAKRRHIDASNHVVRENSPQRIADSDLFNPQRSKCQSTAKSMLRFIAIDHMQELFLIRHGERGFLAFEA
jgi:hypothetical protein